MLPLYLQSEGMKYSVMVVDENEDDFSRSAKGGGLTTRGHEQAWHQQKLSFLPLKKPTLYNTILLVI